MADLVGGALVSAFLNILFDRMASREVIDLLRDRKPLSDPLEKLKIMLRSANSLLIDAEGRQIADGNVKYWVDSLSDVLFAADEVVDEINAEALRRQAEEGDRDRLPLFPAELVPSLSFGSFDRAMKARIERVLERLRFVLDQKDYLGLKEVTALPRRRLERSPSVWIGDPCDVFGRDEDRGAIVEFLVSESVDRISVLPIVGMGGIGKTTLARLVYDDNRVRDCFELRTWVTVSDDFDVFRLAKLVFEGLSSRRCDVEELDQVRVKLTELLRGKKFLVVLDDVWNENYDKWIALKSCFEFGASGSRVVVTTRSETVASKMGSVRSRVVGAMSDEDCWRLFARHAFRNGEPGECRGLEEVGREIVKKCKGLPLAVRSLAGLLRSVPDPKEWKMVLKSDIWELNGEILPALWLSYSYLPSQIKPCFAYCAIFPKDYELEREQIVLLWMAEGLVQPGKGTSMEDVGKEYFQVLLSRSLFQRSIRGESAAVMHDLVHDLAMFVSGQFCARLEGENSSVVSSKTRYLSYARSRFEAPSKFDAFYKAKYLRSLLPLRLSSCEHLITRKVPCDLVPKLSCLRALTLSHYKNITDLPDSIANLKHLRYLDVSHTAIKNLPDSISTLYHLQTLILSSCDSLTQLPTKIGRLINLRHLPISGTNLKEMPMQIGRLTNLQTLTVFVLGNRRGSSIKELSQLHNLRGTLSVLELQNISHAKDALEANFKDKELLKELLLEWNTDTNDSLMEREVLDKMQPHVNLRKLTLKNYGGTKFPDWMGDPSFSNIICISLFNCKYCTSLPPLGQLPSLKELSVAGFYMVEMVGYEFNGLEPSVQPFRSLETLKFEDMLEWREWCTEVETESGSFPRLRELYIENCPKLIGDLPNQIPGLIELVIVGCPLLRAPLPRAPSLCQLDLIDCDKKLLKDITPRLHWLTIGGFRDMEFLNEEITCLEEFNILNCLSLRFFFKDSLPPRLKALGITGCWNLELPTNYHHEWLESLSILSSCASLIHFPMDVFPKLNRLHIEDCENLESLSSSKKSCEAVTSLNFLQISKCPNFLCFSIGLCAPNLTWLWIERCKKLESLPQPMHSHLPSLEVLHLSHCPKLALFPEGGLPRSLSSLSIFSCEKLVAGQKEWNLQSLPRLKSFSISGNCGGFVSFPNEGLLPLTLTSLYISGIPNLESLNHKGLQNLRSLKELKVENCPKLKSIPEEGLPSSLRHLQILNCSLIKEKYQRKYGNYLSEIAQNTCIQIDSEVIL